MDTKKHELPALQGFKRHVSDRRRGVGLRPAEQGGGNIPKFRLVLDLSGYIPSYLAKLNFVGIETDEVTHLLDKHLISLFVSSVTNYRGRTSAAYEYLKCNVEDEEVLDICCFVEDMMKDDLFRILPNWEQHDWFNSTIQWNSLYSVYIDIPTEVKMQQLGIPLMGMSRAPSPNAVQSQYILDVQPLRTYIGETNLETLSRAGINILTLFNVAIRACAGNDANTLTRDYLATYYMGGNVSDMIAVASGYKDPVGDDRVGWEMQRAFMAYEALETLFANTLYGICQGYYYTLRLIQADIYAVIASMPGLQMSINDIHLDFTSYTIVSETLFLVVTFETVVVA